MTDNHGPQIKDDEQYEALREKGMSKEKAARIANTPRGTAAKKGGAQFALRRTYKTIALSKSKASGHKKPL